MTTLNTGERINDYLRDYICSYCLDFFDDCIHNPCYFDCSDIQHIETYRCPYETLIKDVVNLWLDLDEMENNPLLDSDDVENPQVIDLNNRYHACSALYDKALQRLVKATAYDGSFDPIYPYD